MSRKDNLLFNNYSLNISKFSVLYNKNDLYYWINIIKSKDWKIPLFASLLWYVKRDDVKEKRVWFLVNKWDIINRSDWSSFISSSDMYNIPLENLTIDLEQTVNLLEKKKIRYIIKDYQKKA